jgi:hypothetical protein
MIGADTFAAVAQDTAADGDVEQASQEMDEALNKAFHRCHAMSLHLNLVTIGALIAYGWRLALRLKAE